MLHFGGLLTGIAAVTAGAWLAWGVGYALLVSGSLVIAAVIRARQLGGEE